MIDLNDLRARPDAYQDAARKKRIAVDVLAFLGIDAKRRELLPLVESMRAWRNKVSKAVPSMAGEVKQRAIAEMKELAGELRRREDELTGIDRQWSAMQLLLPSIPLPRVPVGKDDTENREVRTWGQRPAFGFPPKDHVTLGQRLDIIDIARGVRIAGSRSYFLKGDAVRLELAVLGFTLDHLIRKGFTPFAPPLMANWEAMMGTSYFPGGEEQAYAVGARPDRDGPMEADGYYLIGTSEVSVASYHQGETLALDDLPRRYCGISNCFRREAGTYGKDTQGLYRVHQFQKVEQVVLCEADERVSAAMHAELLQNAEEVRGQVFKNDIETWMPSRKSYGETHSCSTFHDFQARRLNIKYDAGAGGRKFVHTLNNTCIASPRILIPLLEIYQNADGSVTIPDVLRPYMAGQERITRPRRDP